METEGAKVTWNELAKLPSFSLEMPETRTRSHRTASLAPRETENTEGETSKTGFSTSTPAVMTTSKKRH